MPTPFKPASITDSLPIVLSILFMAGLVVAWLTLTESSLIHLCPKCHFPTTWQTDATDPGTPQFAWRCTNTSCRKYLHPTEGGR